MKRTGMFFALSLMFLLTAAAFAQKPMDEANEKHVKITQGPTISNITGNSATIHWTTNSAGANHVRYRVAGSNGAWKSAFHSGGGTDHSLQLTGLEPGKTYEWQILTRDGDLRTQGQFQTAGSAGGTAPDVNVSSNPPPGGGNSAAGAKVPLYRGVNAQGAHMYSSNPNDFGQGGFKVEGTAGNLLSSQGSDTTALFRLLSPQGGSFLTRDSNERSSAAAQGMQDLGVVGYIATSQQPGTEPLFRLFNPGAGQHFYTTSQSERLQAMQSGMKDEGVIGYVWQ